LSPTPAQDPGTGATGDAAKHALRRAIKKPTPVTNGASPKDAATRQTRSRAGDLLRKAVRNNDLTPDDVAQGLCVPIATVDQLLDGTEVMSLAQQLSFATLLLERAPRFVRSAHALRAQVQAATEFKDRKTEVHSQPPASWRTLKLL
jgi:hypothetical protein